MQKRQLTDEEMIESAAKMTLGTDYEVVQKSVTYTDECKGLPRKDVFRAVEFTVRGGERQFIGELFL